jgi:hypothetical protein
VAVSQVLPLPQVPQLPPQPLSPHFLVPQVGVQVVDLQ